MGLGEGEQLDKEPPGVPKVELAGEVELRLKGLRFKSLSFLGDRSPNAFVSCSEINQFVQALTLKVQKLLMNTCCASIAFTSR